MSALSGYALKKAENKQIYLEELHEKKLKKLIPNFEQNNNTNNKTWVKNLSSRTFTDIEMNVLSKGTKFAVSPRSVPKLDIIAGVEEGLSRLEHNKKQFINIARAKISDILLKAKPPKPNLTVKEKNAMKTLESYQDIVITEADKGNCTVVLDKTDYNDKIMELLQDESTI